MSATGHEKEPKFEAESILDIQLPDIRHATISRMDFAVLKDGEVSGPKASRDACIGVAATALLAVIDMIPSVDWPAKMKAGDILPFVLEGLQVVVFIAFTGLAAFFWRQVGDAKKRTAYTTLIERLESHFSPTEVDKADAAAKK